MHFIIYLVFQNIKLLKNIILLNIYLKKLRFKRISISKNDGFFILIISFIDK